MKTSKLILLGLLVFISNIAYPQNGINGFIKELYIVDKEHRLPFNAAMGVVAQNQGNGNAIFKFFIGHGHNAGDDNMFTKPVGGGQVSGLYPLKPNLIAMVGKEGTSAAGVKIYFVVDPARLPTDYKTIDFNLDTRNWNLKQLPLVSNYFNGDGKFRICVSASMGSDSNFGSQQDPVKTFKRAKELLAEAISLKRGDTFYDNLIVDGIDVDSYGKGSLPNICGLKIMPKGIWERGRVDGKKWVADKRGKVWRAYLAGDSKQYLGYSRGGSSIINNVGQIVDASTGKMIENCRVRRIDELKANYDFWLGNPINDGFDRDAKDFDYVYVFSSDNLNKKSIGLAVYEHGITAANSTIRSVKVSNWGQHGISAKSNVSVIDCVVDGIGGSYFIGYPNWCSYGNGIEYYVGKDGIENAMVKGCQVYHTYDSGITVQGSTKIYHLWAKNVVFENNYCENCCQSFEIFLNGIGEEDIFYDCRISHNVSIKPGMDTGFRYFDGRYKKSHMLDSSNRRRTKMLIVGNVFVDGNLYCAHKCGNAFDQSIWEGNKCVIMRGQDLIGDYEAHNVKVEVPIARGDYQTIEAATQAAISEYRAYTSDQTTEFVIVGNEKEMNPFLRVYSRK